MNVMAWTSVPLSSRTIFCSLIVKVNSTIFGPPSAFCVWACTNGGLTRSTFTRGSAAISALVNGLAAAFFSSAALAADGMTMGATAPANAAPARILRRVMWKVSVIIFLLSLLGQSMLRSVTAFVAEGRKYNLRWSKLRVGPPATFWQAVTTSCGGVAPPLCLFAKKRDGLAPRHMSRPNEEHYNEW
ncbi:membrane hypothetical protein [Agrobacterium tumefaciens str. B6]|uniref:Uncharacterized protein n=1 Tax=Agrobacterium tumefaciens str. B6 TaxID=1183423 RepID=A0A822V4Q4_AGRTU|nr:membrane hypothetical protein [Agrobacterium tumefaciens str. B6]